MLARYAIFISLTIFMHIKQNKALTIIHISYKKNWETLIPEKYYDL